MLNDTCVQGSKVQGTTLRGIIVMKVQTRKAFDPGTSLHNKGLRDKPDCGDERSTVEFDATECTYHVVIAAPQW